MLPAEITSLVLQTIVHVAPEANIENLNPDVRFRDQFDFDSVDFVNLIEQLNHALQIQIPETDYPQLTTLNGSIAYLEKLPQVRSVL